MAALAQGASEAAKLSHRGRASCPGEVGVTHMGPSPVYSGTTATRVPRNIYIYYLASYGGFSFEVLRTHDVEKHSTALEIRLALQDLATSAGFLEVQMPPRIFVYESDL